MLLLGASGATALAVGPIAGETAQSARGVQQTCDYRDVFDRTADSVVSVQSPSGQGTGFAVDVGALGSAVNATVANESSVADGNATALVTNAHVVGEASEVTIQFNNGEYRTGTVIGRSVYADLAVVRVSEAPDHVESLDVAVEGPQRGRRVAALGNPFGLKQTVTHGIVSGVNRSMPTQSGFTIPDVVQTDAPINPGNSGGPLVTCDGTVVGVNSAGIPSARADNIGFAVSASVVQRVVPELVATGEFDYPFLGVSTKPVTPAVAEANDLNETRGLVVVDTLDGGPTSDVLQGSRRVETVDGEQVPVGGDVLLAIDGREIRSGEDLASYLVTETEPGDTVELTVLRDGRRRTVSVTVGERPEPDLG